MNFSNLKSFDPEVVVKLNSGEYRAIPLTGSNGLGKCAVVDSDIYQEPTKRSWNLDTNGYPRINMKIQDKTIKVYMHRYITGLIGPQHSEKIVDHKNKNRLLNVRSNLRISNFKVNSRNSSSSSGSTSSYLGVCWLKAIKKWACGISSGSRGNSVALHLGTFQDEELAASVYNKFSLFFWGEFSTQNNADHPKANFYFEKILKRHCDTGKIFNFIERI